MKILTAMYTLKKGGSYDRFLMMVEAFLEREWEVHCLSLTPIQIRHLDYHNHRIHLPFEVESRLAVKLSVLLLFPLFSLLIAWREKIDLFVAFGALYAFVLTIPKWILKRPLVTFIRGNSTLGLKIQNFPRFILKLNNVMEYFGMMFSKRIITNNQSVQNEIIRKIGKRQNIEIKLLFNNIPPIPHFSLKEVSQIRPHFKIPAEGKVLATAGLLNRGKNLETLIQCIPKIGMNNLFLFIIGDGSHKGDIRYKSFLMKMIEALRLDEKVIWTGWLEKMELWKIYLVADLFVLPSRSEGMPNALLEALGSGLPCVGSDIAGVREVLQYKELLFDPQDEMTLANKIRQFFSDAQFFEEVNRLCQQRKELFRFDWKERVFEEVTRGFIKERRDGATLEPKS